MRRALDPGRLLRLAHQISATSPAGRTRMRRGERGGLPKLRGSRAPSRIAWDPLWEGPRHGDPAHA